MGKKEHKKKIIIVGAGPGGVTSAAILASRDFDVTVFEKKPVVGGRNSDISVNGFKFDVGPTFLMMKFLLDSVFEEAQARSSDYLQFIKLDPMYQLKFKDKDIMVYDDPERMKQEIGRFYPGMEEGYDNFIKYERKRFARIIPCLQKDYSDLSTLLSWHLIKSVPYLSITKSVYDILSGYFKFEDLALAFSFQTKYLGMSAWKCPGGFSMLSYIEHAYGIYHTKGGLSQISEAMAKLARERGAKIELNTPVKNLILDGNKVKGVELETGEKIFADEVVINADFANAMTTLVPEGVLEKYSRPNLDRKKFSCSTFMIYLGLDKIYPLPHHTILFANDYRTNVDEIFETGKLSKDISFYVRNASVSDDTLAPKGKSGLYILAPVPNLDSKINWAEEKQKYREIVLKSLKTRLGLPDIDSHIEVEKIITPNEWKNDYDVYKGATFNLAHNLSQMAYWRPRNRFEELQNCYLVGGGTHPGSGLPTIYESARITANLISKRYGIDFITRNLVIGT
jgi:phytoene desaturase